MEPGKQYDVNPNQYGGKVGGCCCKIKTAWGKGSTTETPIRHANGLKRRYLFFFFLKMLKIWVDRTTLNGQEKGMALDDMKERHNTSLILSGNMILSLLRPSNFYLIKCPVSPVVFSENKGTYA